MGLAPPLTRLRPLGHSVALWRESAVVPSLTKASRERIQAGGQVHEEGTACLLTYNLCQSKRIYG